MRLALGLLVLLATAAAAQAADPVPPRFVDVSDRLPQPPHTYAGGWTHFVGGGVAVFDCNGDRLPDFAVAGGDNAARLFVNRATPGTLAFENGPALPNAHAVTGLWPLDIDSDGLVDLAVSGSATIFY